MIKLKEQICDVLAAFVRQRPGLEYGNYGDRVSYNAEVRTIARDKREAETLLQAVRLRDSITAEDLIAASKAAFSGRLAIEVKKEPVKIPAFADESFTCGCGLHVHPAKINLAAIHIADCVDKPMQTVKIDYTTGQYWPTEYRKAVAAVCAHALWSYMLEHGKPAPIKHRVTSQGIWKNDRFVHEESELLELHAACKLLQEKGGEKYGHIEDVYRDGKGRPRLTSGEWIRRQLRKEFGRSIQNRWFH